MSTAISDIKSFYTGKSIFLTGGTGFLGKVLIEKLLYSCEDISRIYLLVRPKRGKAAQHRINELFNLPVSVVFHLAATVNFKETLQDALDVNVYGTKELLKLCLRMKKLQAFVYVSTAFSNADRKDVREVVYPAPHSLEQAQYIARSTLQDTYCLGNKPNAYTYSKALAEEIIQENSDQIPCAIVRPSIVISSLKEPCAGWIDSWHGATGVFLGLSLGVLKVFIGRKHKVTDLVPVDIVTNLTIVTAAKCQDSKKMKVYNCCTGKSNPITFYQGYKIIMRTTRQYSLNELPWPYVIFTSSTALYKFLNFFLQMIPSYLADFLSRLMGKPARYVQIQMKVMELVLITKFFFLHQWNFSDENVRALWYSLSKVDKEIFNFDVKSFNWEECINNYLFGARKFLMNKSQKNIC